MTVETLVQLSSYIGQGWAQSNRLGPILDALHTLLSYTATGTFDESLVLDYGAPTVLAKIISEASDSSDQEDETLDKIKHHCLCILSNMSRVSSLAPAIASSDACVQVVLFSLLNEHDSVLLMAAIRVLQTFVTVLPTVHLLDLVGAILDLDAKPMSHLLFIVRNTYSAPLFKSALELLTSLVWLFHCRISVDGITDDDAFPFLSESDLRLFVEYLVALASPDLEPDRKRFDVSWDGALAVIKCLGTLALVSPEWRQQLLVPHSPKLYHLFTRTWPSLVYDPNLVHLTTNWVYLLASLDPKGWPHVFRDIQHVDQHAAGELVKLSQLQQLNALAAVLKNQVE